MLIIASVCLSLYLYLGVKPSQRNLILAAYAGFFLVVSSSVVGIFIRNDERVLRTGPTLESASSSLFIRSLRLPRNAFIFGNEVFLYLREYLNDRTLITNGGNSANLLNADSRQQGLPKTADELLQAIRLQYAPYDDSLSVAKANELLGLEHFEVGIAGQNRTVFLLGEAYSESNSFYLYEGINKYFIVPNQLAERLNSRKEP